MSRVGESPIIIPAEVTVEKNAGQVNISGPKGALSLNVEPLLTVEVAEGKILVKRKNNLKKTKSLHGLTRNLLANMVTGVTSGWSKNLELLGIGFKAESVGGKLTLNVGFSHPVYIEAPEGISFEVVDNTKIKVLGISKQLVGQIAANIKKIKIPDVYKGKGIRFEGEYIRKKVGKSAKVGATGGVAAGK